MRHEVNEHVEDDDLDKHKRYVYHSLRDSECRGSIEREGLVLEKNWLGFEGSCLFSQGEQGIEQEEEEQRTTTRECTSSSIRKIEEESLVAEHDEELAVRAGHDLLVEGNLVVLLLALLRLMRATLLSEGLQFSLELIDIAKVLLIILASTIGVSECLGRARNTILPALANAALVIISHRGEEIGSCPTLWAIEAKIEEIILRVLGTTKVKALTMVDEQDFVCKVVELFTGLIQRYGSGGVGHVALDRRTSDHGLCDGDTLSLTTRDTADELIAYFCTERVLDPEELGNDTKKFANVIFSRLSIKTRLFTSAGATKNKKQFARSHAAVKVADEVANRWFRKSSFRTLGEELAQLAWETQEKVSYGRLKTRTQSNATNSQTAENDTAVARLFSLALLLSLLSKDARHEPVKLFIVLLLLFLLGWGACIRLATGQNSEQVIFCAVGFALLVRWSVGFFVGV
ncbi:hypothetical protein HG531_009374 [Fusarium graminearum]|nr:hypothetical protein HG531_009374 [Fusarium graminearum]